MEAIGIANVCIRRQGLPIISAVLVFFYMDHQF